MRKTLAAIAVGLAAALTLAGCSSAGAAKSDTTGQAASAGPLTIGEFTDVTSWDPALADIGFDGPYMSAVYDSLLSVNGQGKPEPALATSWTVSKDFTTITLNLRTGVKFSDGEPFNAQAAVINLNYLKKGVRSGEAYLNVKDFKAINDDTVQIDMTQRDDTLLYFMGLGRSWMAAPKAIEAGTLAKHPVGSGPYTLASDSVPGSVYNFTKVKNYWDAKAFPFSPLTIKPIQDATARDNAMLAGQVNLIYGDQTAIAEAKKKNWNVSTKVSSWVGLQFTDRAGSTFKPLGNLKVRQALNYAFDGAQILKSIGTGLGVETNQVFPATMEGNDPSLNDMYAYDLSKAKQLMSQAGYANGFSVDMPMTQVFQAWQPIVNQVFKQLGITVNWKDMQYPDYQKNAPTYPMFVALIAIDSNAVANVQRQIHTVEWYNPTPQTEKFPNIQAQIEKVLAAAPADQPDQITQLNKMVTQEAWFDVWYQAMNVYVSTPNITVTPVTGMMFPTLRQITAKG